MVQGHWSGGCKLGGTQLNMKRAAILTTVAAALLLLSSTSTSRANVEAGEGDSMPNIDLNTLTDRAETLYNTMTEQTGNVDMDTPQAQTSMRQ